MSKLDSFLIGVVLPFLVLFAVAITSGCASKEELQGTGRDFKKYHGGRGYSEYHGAPEGVRAW